MWHSHGSTWVHMDAATSAAGHSRGRVAICIGKVRHVRSIVIVRVAYALVRYYCASWLPAHVAFTWVPHQQEQGAGVGWEP
jgi:hypothetical protein